MDGASATVLSVLPQAASAIISAATNSEGQLSAAQPQVGAARRCRCCLLLALLPLLLLLPVCLLWLLLLLRRA